MKIAKPLAVVGLGLLTGCASTSIDAPRPGETWCVSTEKLQLRERADGFSGVKKTLSYGDKVVIGEVVRVAAPYKGDTEKFPENMLPFWVNVSASGQDGYLPVSSLASEWLMENQDPNASISSSDVAGAKRGFSESEDDAEQAAMRGAAGAGKVAATADAGAVEKVLKERGYASDAEVSSFVSGGAFGAPVSRNATVLDVAPRGAFSSAGVGMRKFGAAGLGMASDQIAANSAGTPGGSLVSGAGKVAADTVYSEMGAVQEYQLGKAVAARIIPMHPLLDKSHPASVYVNKVGGMLAAASNDPMPYKGYRFLVMQSDEVNAFAVPGGFVFITTGMLKFLKDEDELVAILGHEMGHMELRHGVQAVGKEKVLKLFTLAKKMATGDAGAGASALTAQFTELVDEVFNKMTGAIRDGYGIEMESQADWRAVQFAKDLGYDDKALYDILERFKAMKGSYGGAGYPVERAADILVYRTGFGCSDAASKGREKRAARYAAAVAGLKE